MNQSTEPREDMLTVSPPSWSREPRWAWMARAFPATVFARALGAVALVIGTNSSPRLSGSFDTAAAQEKLSGYVTWTSLRPIRRRPLTIAQARRLALAAMADAETARARFAEEEAARFVWWDNANP